MRRPAPDLHSSRGNFHLLLVSTSIPADSGTTSTLRFVRILPYLRFSVSSVHINYNVDVFLPDPLNFHRSSAVAVDPLSSVTVTKATSIWWIESDPGVLTTLVCTLGTGGLQGIVELYDIQPRASEQLRPIYSLVFDCLIS